MVTAPGAAGTVSAFRETIIIIITAAAFISKTLAAGAQLTCTEALEGDWTTLVGGGEARRVVGGADGACRQKQMNFS